MDAKLTLELYCENGKFGIYLSDNVGGSGIDVKGETPEEAAENIAPYIADYFYNKNEE